MLSLYVTLNSSNGQVSTSLKGEGTTINKLIEDDIVVNLVAYIVHRKPDKIIFNNSTLKESTLELLYEHEISVDENDNVYYDPTENTYTSLDKHVEYSSAFELVVKYTDYLKQDKILTDNGYEFDVKILDDGRVKFVVNH